MHGFSKVMIGIAVVGLILSVVLMIIGYVGVFSSMDLETEQDLIWEQNAPASWDASDVDSSTYYYVYIADGGNVSVELIGSDEYNYFISCESTNNCNSSDIAGYTYVGELMGFQWAEIIATLLFKMNTWGTLYFKRLRVVKFIRCFCHCWLLCRNVTWGGLLLNYWLALELWLRNNYFLAENNHIWNIIFYYNSRY